VTPAALAELVRATAVDVLTSRMLDPAAVPPAVTIQRPRRPGHGDYATNLALVVAKKIGVGSRDLAGWLADALTAREAVARACVAGPGFVNLQLTPAAQGRVVREVLVAGTAYGGNPAPVLPDAPAHDPRVRSLQYVHARLVAVARNAVELGIAGPDTEIDLTVLAHPREGELIRAIGEYGELASRGQARSILRYLEELVTAYHRFTDTCRVLPQGDEQATSLTTARLALCAATRQVLANGLGLLRVPAPERM
jgi:arginyl-tRNA synthetase